MQSIFLPANSGARATVQLLANALTIQNAETARAKIHVLASKINSVFLFVGILCLIIYNNPRDRTEKGKDKITKLLIGALSRPTSSRERDFDQE
jgi:hypothetical protein